MSASYPLYTAHFLRIWEFQFENQKSLNISSNYIRYEKQFPKQLKWFHHYIGLLVDKETAATLQSLMNFYLTAQSS